MTEAEPLGTLPVEERAKALYEGYFSASGGKAHDGSDLPTWEQVRSDENKSEVFVWMAVAKLSLQAKEAT